MKYVKWAIYANVQYIQIKYTNSIKYKMGQSIQEWAK